MFYESLFVPPGADPFPKSIIDEPHLARYYLDWGRAGDHCHILEVDGSEVGAIWTRLFTTADPGYGFVADDVPELGIALQSDWTGQGIGSKMMTYHLDYLKKNGCERVSLSVDVRNPAYRLYLRLGFEIVSQKGDSGVMAISI